MDSTDGGAARHVVLGFDAGWRMNNLLRVAANEAASRELTLAIVTVARPVLDPDLSVSGQRTAERQAQTVALQHLSRAAATVHDAREHLPVSTHYLTEEEAHGGQQPLASARLLVVGIEGQHGRRAFSLESASRILHEATHCPVLVVPDEEPVASGVRRDVVAGVGEHVSDSAVIRAAWAESVQHRCGLEVVHAYRQLTAETPEQGLRRAADVVARAIAGSGVTPGDRVSVLLSRDDPAAVLTQRAGAAVMLVIGSRPGSLSGLVLGSVGGQLLDSPACPMLVISDPAHDRAHATT